MKRIWIQSGAYKIEAELYDTPTAQAIWNSLPVESSVNTWGDEIYFGISAQADLEPDAKAEVGVGDLAYWPTMPAFCIFFGPTPGSIGEEPRAASAVNVFGKLKEVDLEKLKSLRSGEIVTVKKSEP